LNQECILAKIIIVDFILHHIIVTNVVGRPKSGMPLSPEDQEYILEEVNGFDIPIIKYDVDADSKEVRVKIDGPWAGLRSGLSVGYRF